VDAARYANAARVGETLQPRRDVDAVAINLLAVDDYVAEVDADAKLHPALGQARVLSLERSLDPDCALDGVHHAGKLRENAVGRGIAIQLSEKAMRLARNRD
jgi:hypothetical protein